jgi:phosphopantothenoylcysteine decarboxylase/phosphopantothenate--cysteine ligase
MPDSQETKQPARARISNLLIAVTGSVGVVVVPHYITLLRQKFAQDVWVIMSQAAQKFVTPFTMRLFSGHYVFTDLFQAKHEITVPHLQLARSANLLLIMPATANVIAKAAHGMCDDLITTTIVASKAPVVFVPSMNEDMWMNKAVQRNVGLLRELNYHIIPPGHGYSIIDGADIFGVIPQFDVLLQNLHAVLEQATVIR